MSCEHRYIAVASGDGKAKIECRRCGDVFKDGIPTRPDNEAILDRLRWERRKKDSPLIIPGIESPWR